MIVVVGVVVVVMWELLLGLGGWRRGVVDCGLVGVLADEGSGSVVSARDGGFVAAV